MSDELEWMRHAACIGQPLDDWFDHPKTPAGRQRLARALAICMTCRVRAQCLDWTLRDIFPTDLDDTGGVWGGTTQATRRIIRYERTYARPHQ
jgi:WhiB family redox-sensing transcriptional regulator